MAGEMLGTRGQGMLKQLVVSLKPGSQYDAGATSVTSVVSLTEKSLFHQSNCIPDVNFFDNLIGWTLANARDATLE